MDWRATILRACLLAGWLAAVHAQAPQAPEPARGARAEQLACVLCEGRSTSAQPCWICAGEKVHPCARCNPRDELVRGTARLEALARRLPGDAELQAALARARSTAAANLGRLRKELGQPEPEEDAGRVACPARCFDGAQPAMSGAACKLCDGKADVACPDCAGKGRLACGACAGKGVAVRACAACNGEKSLALPPREPPAACGWCAGAGLRPCAECDADGKAVLFCRACNGKALATCARCLGGKREACKPCLGTGTIHPTYGIDPPRACGACKASGKAECTGCAGHGKVECAKCEGERQVRGPCERCLGRRRAVCLGCADDVEPYWESSADLLLARGDSAAAAAYLEAAARRLEERFELRSRELRAAGDERPQDRLALQKRLALERARLARRLDAARR